MLDICCIGHITVDRIITPDSMVMMPGGTTYYFSHGISKLINHNPNVSYKLIASLAKSEMKSVEEIRQQGIDVQVVDSRKTVFFENIYEKNQNNRKQRVHAMADPFSVDALKDVEAKYICLGSLLPKDFSLDVVKYLSNKGSIVMDAQGFLRDVKPNGDVYACDWNNKFEYFKYIDILKVNEYEVEVLTGKKDLHQAAMQLAQWGIKEVLLTLGSYGSIVLVNGTFYDIDAYKPLSVVDATGCGDTYVMGYVYKRVQGASPLEAAKFATAVSTCKLEAHGPFQSTETEAINRIDKS